MATPPNLSYRGAAIALVAGTSIAASMAIQGDGLGRGIAAGFMAGLLVGALWFRARRVHRAFGALPAVIAVGAYKWFVEPGTGVTLRPALAYAGACIAGVAIAGVLEILAARRMLAKAGVEVGAGAVR